MRLRRLRVLYPPLARAWVKLLEITDLQSVGDHRLDLVLLRLGDVSALAKLSLGAGLLVGKDMAQVGALALDATGGRELKALLDSALRLHLQLGHWRRAVYTERSSTQAIT